MKIAIINGSQKPGESNTGIILRELISLVNKDHKITNHVLGVKQFSPEMYKEIMAGEVLVLGFPLYVDSIPSNMLKMLIELEEYIKKEDVQDIMVYTIINNGFYEGRQTHIAFEIIQNWCERAGVKFCGGIGQGAGEMIGATKNTPINKGPFNNLGRELALLVKTIELKEPFWIKYLSPCFPRFLWRFMAKHTFWHSLAYKNKLKKKDILKRIM
ncbi:MAG: NAD(P)H-dependent oxidoreductase [Spirochaetaceae bacterium]|jgi:multimeric flavodoxin WrbA|nr:NAD(P)H-dependent oxidoreductase [Spirochaetaceae bacterium]